MAEHSLIFRDIAVVFTAALVRHDFQVRSAA